VFTRRNFLAILAGGACANASAVLAQQPAKVWRIGFLGLTSSRAAVSVGRVEALRTGLRELGYIEGKNIAMEFRWADGDYARLPGLADELVRAKVDVLVTYSTPGAMAAKNATRMIPIVLASVGDPVSTGIVTNLARPGANITGLSIFTPGEMAKRLELLKDAFPHIRRVAVLLNGANPLGSKTSLPVIEQAARKLGLELHVVDARGVGDFEKAFATMVDKRVEGLVVFEEAMFTGEASKLAALALRHRLPAIGQVAFAESGGLMGNGANQLELFRRAAGFIDQILKGAKAGDLPVQQASRFELVVNMNTATALGITLPKQLLFRADRTIE
jgi:putative ABC transport system substrate-binding protein